MLLQAYMLFFLDQFQEDSLLSFNFLFNTYLFLSAALSVALLNVSCSDFSFLTFPLLHFTYPSISSPHPLSFKALLVLTERTKLAVYIMLLNKEFAI